jgi:hypothetical protein
MGEEETGDPLDTRPLFEKLKENQEKADAQRAAMIHQAAFSGPKRLDDDEVLFLIEQDQRQREAENKFESEVAQFKEQVNSVVVKPETSSILTLIKHQKQAKSPPAKRAVSLAAVPIAAAPSSNKKRSHGELLASSEGGDDDDDGPPVVVALASAKRTKVRDGDGNGNSGNEEEVVVGQGSGGGLLNYADEDDDE